MLVQTLPQTRRFSDLFCTLGRYQTTGYMKQCASCERPPISQPYNQHPATADSVTSVPVYKLILSSIQDYYEDPVSLPMFSPNELVGMTVLREVDDQLVHGKVVRKIMDSDAENHQQIKFLLALGDGKLEEIISYMN